MIFLIEWITQTKIDKLSSLATVLGVLAIIIAWVGLKRTWRTERASHMNSLFREFLRLEFDFYNADHSDEESCRRARETLRSYKMWVLEEIWMWADENRHKVFLLRPGMTNGLRNAVANWDETIKYHLHRDAEMSSWADFELNQGCYHKGFVEFAREWNPSSPDHKRLRRECHFCKAGSSSGVREMAQRA